MRGGACGGGRARPGLGEAHARRGMVVVVVVVAAVGGRGGSAYCCQEEARSHVVCRRRPLQRSRVLLDHRPLEGGLGTTALE